MGFPGGSSGKEYACNAGDQGSIPGLGTSPGEGNSYPLQYSDLEKSMGCIAHGVERVRHNWTSFTYIYDILKKQSLVTENRWVVYKVCEREEIATKGCIVLLFVMIELVFVLIMVTRLHEFVKTHKTIQQNFSYLCKIYFHEKRKLLKKTVRISKEFFTKERKLRLLEICKEKNNTVNTSKYLALKVSLGRLNIFLQIYKIFVALKKYLYQWISIQLFYWRVHKSWKCNKINHRIV